MNTGYLEALDYRLRELVEQLAYGGSLDDVVDFVTEEVTTSYYRGLLAGERSIEMHTLEEQPVAAV